jgi:hypothetical protein
MSIQKKSLISTLKTTKKANIASAPVDTATDAKAGQSVKLGQFAHLSRARFGKLGKMGKLGKLGKMGKLGKLGKMGKLGKI